jgi:hypothetical protein
MVFFRKSGERLEAKMKREAALDELIVGKSTEEMVGPKGLLKQLTKALLERARSAELPHHLGDEKHEPGGRGRSSSRHGQSRNPCRATAEAWKSLFPATATAASSKILPPRTPLGGFR